MRRLDQITSTIAPLRSGSRSYARRPLAAYAGHLTVLMLVRHAESATEIQVSDDGDAVGAVWIPRALISIERADRGRFLVVTLPLKLARDNRLTTPIIDRSRMLPQEIAQLDDALAAAKRGRDRLTGNIQSSNRPTWSGGRNVYA